jgi:hypothetical protein
MKYNLPLIRERLTAAGIPFESRNESVVRVYLPGETLTAEICWFNYGDDFSFGWTLSWDGRASGNRAILDAARLALPVIDMVEAP